MSDAPPPSCAVEAVLVPSNEIPADAVVVEGPKLVGSSLENVIGAYKTVGYQATNVGVALEELEAMLAWRMCDDQVALNTARKHGEVSDEEARRVRTKIFLGATSALFLAGSREAINFLCRHRMVDVIVTPGGGIDFDILRALHPEHVTVGAGYGGAAPGTSTQGNLSVKEPESRNAVVAFVVEILEAEAAKAKSAADLVFTPSSFVKVMGTALHERGLHSSCIAWAAVNNLPVYSPSLVDGWVGEAFYEFNKKRKAAQLPTAKLDLVTDVRLMNTEATSAKHTGMLILGGGVVKHHICNANLMRNGADHSVLIGTGQEFDGSDAGARPDEAVSWGKIRPGTKPVKVYTDATVVLPLLVAKVFVPYYLANKSLYP